MNQPKRGNHRGRGKESKRGRIFNQNKSKGPNFNEMIFQEDSIDFKGNMKNNLNQTVNPVKSIPNAVIPKPSTLRQPAPNPSLGSKFKPLEGTASPQQKIKTNVPKPTIAEVRKLAPDNQSSIITVVGNKKKNAVNSQKKILQFQMKMMSIQQDKIRLSGQQIQPSVISAFEDPIDIFENTSQENDMQDSAQVQNSGLLQNPGQVQNPGQMQNPGQVQTTDKVHNLRPVQNPVTEQKPMETQLPMKVSNVEPVPNPAMQNYGTAKNAQGSFTPPGVPNVSGTQNTYNNTLGANQSNNPGASNVKRGNTYVHTAPQPQPVKKNKKKKVVESVSKPDVVETVFQVNKEQPRSFTPPINTKPSNYSNPQRYSKQSGRSKMYHDRIAFSYPKGIPRSFLVQQQQASNLQSGSSDGPIWPSYQLNPQMVPPPVTEVASQAMPETEVFPQPYSPSELYADIEQHGCTDEDMEDPELQDQNSPGQKRLSAFQRLGPQTQVKKPKLTISVTVNEDQEVREVVDETENVEEITPVHLREDIILSTDETVMKYLKCWPWKRNVVVKKSVTARNSKTVMMLEREQMEEIYNKDTIFVQVTVKGYPSTWKKEQVLDTLMDNIRLYSFIPCFIEFNLQECKFLTLRCRSALLSLHKCGFIIRKNEVELCVTIAQTELTLNQLDFVPRLVLRKRLIMCSDKQCYLDLTAFTLKEDISHFIYYPLNRSINQMGIIEMQNDISWKSLTHLNLSHNRIESLDGFDLEQTAPKLIHLDLSYNYLEKITILLKIRQLPLQSIHLEGNPFCRNYIDPDQYVKAVKMMFSTINTIDGVPIRVKGEMPKFHRNYCPEGAQEIVEKFLEVFFPLLDGNIEHRLLLEDMYDAAANMSITYSYKMSFSPIYRNYRSLFSEARRLEQGNMDVVKGSKAIVNCITTWPHMEHDPLTFTVDVVYHNDSTTIVRIDGILKLTRESLAEDEYLLAFSRTVVLNTSDALQYKIVAETLYWSTPSNYYASSAFSVTTIKKQELYPIIESTTDEKLQKELLKIFMQLTTMNKNISERCLELKKWNLREALDHFTKLLKLDALESLTKEVS